MEWDPRVLAHAPWSVSKAGTLSHCARQYWHKYVQKHPEEGKSTQSQVGVAAHEVQERVLREGPSQAQEVLRETVTKHELSRAEELEVSARFPAVLDYAERIQKFKEDQGVVTELIEYKLAMTPDATSCAFFEKTGVLRGVIDHALLTRSGVLVVIDHKSGKRKPIAQHSTQFYAYMALVYANFPHVQGVQSAINYFGAPRLDWFPKFGGASGPWPRVDIERHVFPWLNKYLNGLTRQLAVVDSGEPPAETGWQCEWCGYVSQCESGAATVAERRAKRGLAPQTNV